jgi:hypothetical protein
MSLPRLRQVVLAARKLEPVAASLETALGVRDPFYDEGVGHFGLRNAVYALGDTFVEIVSPQQPDTSAGRYLDRRGGDSGYMVMFEVADAVATRHRLTDLGVRTIWESEHDDITDLHLHPKDVAGAIVALDVTTPVGSWRWAGPGWVGAVPAFGPGGITGLTVAAVEPEETAARWAAVVGVAVGSGGAVPLAGGAQLMHFVSVADRAGEGIVGVEVVTDAGAGGCDIAGVRFDRRHPDDTRGQHP